MTFAYGLVEDFPQLANRVLKIRLQKVHRKIDRAAAAAFGAGVKPFGSGRK